MAEKIILHLTDLHIKKPGGTKEHLRKKFYREYIDPLVEQISKITDRIDSFIITGDFVDSGSVENFAHVEIVIDYLAQKIKVDKANIGLCIGNHDYKYDFDEKGLKEDARKEYVEFCKRISKAKVIKSIDRATLYEFNSDIFYLSLDSTLGTKSIKFGPGKMEDEEIDIIVDEFIRDNDLLKNKLLIVASHFPIFISDKAKFLFQEKVDLFTCHFWQSATLLFTRIQNCRRGINTVWLFGDIHAPYHDNKDSHCIIQTGRFGGEILDISSLTSADENINILKKMTHQNRQAVLIKISTDVGEVFTFNYKMLGHTESNMNGEWDIQSSKLELKKSSMDDIILPTQGRTEENGANKSTVQKINFELISTSIEGVMLEKIEKEKLYQFNRFATSKDEVSLGWVSINQLLNSGSILSQIIEKSSEWLIQKLKNNIEKTVIVGLDFWGAIIGSQISVRTDIPNLCSASRANAKHHSIHETFEEKNFIEMIESDQTHIVVLISDVIASGHTIINNKETIKAIFKRFNKTLPKWYCISIIADSGHNRMSDLLEFEAIGVFCEKLRIPVISPELLPSEKILPPYLDFNQ